MNVKITNDDQYQEHFLHRLNDLRSKEELCDVVFVFPGEHRKLHAHKAVIAGSSGYFKALFTSDYVDSRLCEVELPWISADTMEEIVNYIYTQNTKITMENVERLTVAADRLHIFGIQKICSDFLGDQVCLENCIGLHRFAVCYNCSTLREKCWTFILRSFKRISECSSEFLQLEREELLGILKDDFLCLKKEDYGLTIIFRWISFSSRSRWADLLDLLNALRIGYLNKDIFENDILCNADILGRPKLSHSVTKIYQYITDLHLRPNLFDSRLRPRIPQEIVFVIGGWSMKGVTHAIETYDNRVEMWFSKQICLPGPRAYHGSVVLNGLIYIIGGYDGSSYHNSVHSYDLSKKAWFERAPMYSQRCYVAAALLCGRIYVCGGFDGRTRHSSAERYNPKNNQWRVIAPMTRQRSDAGAATLEGKLYVAGGFDGHSCLNCTEIYDPLTNQWTLIQQLTKCRSGVGLAAYRGEIVAIGGYDGSERLKCAESYSPLAGKWRSFEEMSFGRSNFALTVIEDDLMVMGGYDGTTTSSCVELYDPDRRQWIAKPNMVTGRSAVSACTVIGTQNAKDFTFHGHRVNDESVTSKL